MESISNIRGKFRDVFFVFVFRHRDRGTRPDRERLQQKARELRVPMGARLKIHRDGIFSFFANLSRARA